MCRNVEWRSNCCEEGVILMLENWEIYVWCKF